MTVPSAKSDIRTRNWTVRVQCFHRASPTVAGKKKAVVTKLQQLGFARLIGKYARRLHCVGLVARVGLGHWVGVTVDLMTEREV
jgi:hypothetical protein